MVIGMTIVIVCGAFDMSVGSAMALCGLVAALAMKDWGFSVPLAVLAALLAGAVIGWINGAIVTRLKINPFITTLGTMSILRGIGAGHHPSKYADGLSRELSGISPGARSLRCVCPAAHRLISAFPWCF